MKKVTESSTDKGTEKFKGESFVRINERPKVTSLEKMERELRKIGTPKQIKLFEKMKRDIFDQKFDMNPAKKFCELPYEVVKKKPSIKGLENTVFIPEGTTKIFYVTSEKKRKRLDRKLHKHGKNPTYFVMPAIIPTAIHQIEGTLALKGKRLTQVERAELIITGCTANANVTISGAKITAATGFKDTYRDSSSGGRKTARRNMVNYLTDNLLAPFQAAANLDPDNAVDILESGNFKVKTVSPKQKQVVGVKNSSITGKILFEGPGTGQGTAHDWWLTLDNGVTAVRMDPTIKSKASKTGLTVRTHVGIAHQSITRKGPQGISEFVYVDVT